MIQIDLPYTQNTVNVSIYTNIFSHHANYLYQLLYKETGEKQQLFCVLNILQRFIVSQRRNHLGCKL